MGYSQFRKDVMDHFFPTTKKKPFTFFEKIFNRAIVDEVGDLFYRRIRVFLLDQKTLDNDWQLARYIIEGNDTTQGKLALFQALMVLVDKYRNDESYGLHGQIDVPELEVLLDAIYPLDDYMNKLARELEIIQLKIETLTTHLSLSSPNFVETNANYLKALEVIRNEFIACFSEKIKSKNRIYIDGNIVDINREISEQVKNNFEIILQEEWIEHSRFTVENMTTDDLNLLREMFLKKKNEYSEAFDHKYRYSEQFENLEKRKQEEQMVGMGPVNNP